MKLEEITAEIRPRTQWESVDLGVTLTRQHFSKLALIWIFTVFPIWALLILVFRESPFWCLFWIHFLRPVYERPILFFLSRALFNAPPSIRSILKGYFKIIAPGLIRSLTIARFSWLRSLLLPLHVLEGAKESQYVSRRNAIIRNGGGTGGYLTFACLLLQAILVLGFTFLIIAFIPQDLAPDWGEMLQRFFYTSDGMTDGLPLNLAWFLVGIILVAISFVEIFYVGCGFALYLNSRTHVEGWDIEITFRRLAEKLQPTANSMLALLLGVVLSLSLTPPAKAQDESDSISPKAEIRKILKHEDFTIHKQEFPVRENEPFSESGSDLNFGFLAALGEVLFYLLIAAAIAGIAWVIYLNRHLFSGMSRATSTETAPPSTRTVMGMDVASDTLPSDIPAAALAAWQSGNPQLATSLLYRGAICWLVEAARLPLHDSDTENDCLTYANSLSDTQQRDYFNALTSQWIRTAYNKTPPSESDIRTLCSTWPFNAGRIKS